MADDELTPDDRASLDDLQRIAESVEDADPIAPVPEASEETTENRSNVIDAFFGGPKKPKKDRPERPKKPLPPRRVGSLTKRLEKLYVGIGMMLLPFDEPCANAILNSAEKCAESLDNLAYENDAVRRVLLSMLETNAWGQALFAHMPIILVVLVHHTNINQAAMGKIMSVMQQQKEPPSGVVTTNE